MEALWIWDDDEEGELDGMGRSRDPHEHPETDSVSGQYLREAGRRHGREA